MTIDITKAASEAFYKEAVNVVHQYKRILKHPDRKLRDLFKGYKIDMAAAAAVLVLSLANIFIWGFDNGMFVCAAFMILLMIFCAVMLKNAKDMVKTLSENHSSSFTVDEDGVEVAHHNAQTVRMAWDKVAFIKSYSQCTCFIPSSMPGFVFTVDNEYKEQVLEYVKSIGKGDLIR